MLVSVLTPTRNRGELLLRKLRSLERQSLSPDRFEWIVCDDGGNDGSRELLLGAGSAFRMEVLRFPQRRGAGAARNACAARASGEILYLSDDDCLLPPGTLERHLEAQRTPVVAIGGIDFTDDQGKVERWRPRRPGYWNVNGANTSFPAAAFRLAGGFDEGLREYGGEDLLLGYALARSGLPIVAVDAPVRHLGPNPMSGSDLDKARSAGRNAVRITRSRPELAWRLGVHPLLLVAKRAILGTAAPMLRGRARVELAYLRGALEEGRRPDVVGRGRDSEDDRD